MIFLKELCFLLLFLAGFCTGDDNELKLNMVGFTSTPAVQNSKETIIRGYTLGSDISDNITLSIDWLDNIGNLSGNQLCNNSNASEFAYVECNLVNTDFAKYRQATISCSNSGCTDNARIGVFTAYVEKDTRIATATIIVHHNNAYVKPIVRAKTVNAGDSNVKLGVRQFNGSENDLRWAKDGTIDSNWNGLKKIIFDTITVADAGIYECFEVGRWEERKHAFMQLIVRECPHNKWSPPHCNMSCDVCYNGGVCDTYIGTCICPSGFDGSNCEIPTGGNTFGRDGGTQCTTGNNEGCEGKLICPPAPQGCACHAGWKGFRCKWKCKNGKYGADCLQVCHCDNCDRFIGCDVNATCRHGYSGPRCLDKDSSQESSDRTTPMSTLDETTSNGPSSDRSTSKETTHATYSNRPSGDGTTSVEISHVTNFNRLSTYRTTSMDTSHGNVYW